MRPLLAFLVFVPFVGAAPAPVKKQNLLINGSFENGPPIGNYRACNVDSTEIEGWVVTRAQIDIVGAYWPAADGKRSIDLHGSPGFGGIKQTFATKPGRTYIVTFALAANPDGSVPKKKMAVAAAREKVEFDIETTGRTLKEMKWERKSWRFTATEEKTTLELYTLCQDDDACGPVIDDVSVIEND